VSWADASGVLSAIEDATKANIMVERIALICLFIELNSLSIQMIEE
jgi:hypothetical protein